MFERTEEQRRTMNLQLFAVDPPKQDPPKQDLPKQDPPKQDPPEPKKPFASFEDENAFNARMDREAKRRLADAAKAAGFDSVEAFEAAAKKAKEAEEAAKTETQRAKEEAEREKAKSADALTKASKALVDAEVIRQATGLGFADPTDAIAMLDRANVKVDLDASKVEGVKEALTELLKAKPHLQGNGKKLPDKSGEEFKGNVPTEGGGLEGALARHYAKK